MPIIVNGHNILNPSIKDINLKRVMVGDKQVFPYGEAWFDWPYYTDECVNSSYAAGGMAKIIEDQTNWEAFAPIFAPGYSPNFTTPWWGTVTTDDNGCFCIKIPANQAGSYRVTGSVDVINSSDNLPIILLESSMTYTYGTTSYAANATIYNGNVPSGRWVTYPIDVTMTTNYGYAQKIYPFSYCVVGSASLYSYLPFRFSNIRIGIQRVYV